MTTTWPKHLDVGAVRFARPTVRYDEILSFYRDDLELPVLAAWQEEGSHAGVVFGLPGTPVHMEITQSGHPPRIPEPHPENQLVLYVRGPGAVEAGVARMRERGHEPVEAANSYWPERGAVVFADPDGWMVILAPWVFGEDPVPTPA
ncbi:VOC family protein [Streptomyces sp. NPDC054863]